MSKYLHKASSIGLGLSVPMVLVADVARSQAKPAKTEANPPKTVGGIALPDPNAINKKIQQNYPPELLSQHGNRSLLVIILMRHLVLFQLTVKLGRVLVLQMVPKLLTMS
jgi:hypothetical protein